MGDTGENPQLGQYNASNMCYASGDVKTSFATEEDIDSMKQMVAATDPGAVTEVGDAWHKIHQKLVVEDGSVKGDFDKAVEHILQHWEGESADEFAKKAKKVSKSIADCGTYAQYTAIAMHTAGRKLSEVKPEVMAIEKPGGFSKAMNSLGDGFSRDDKNWRGEISQNEGAQKALDNHHDDLSAGKEEQLKAAAKMEALAAVYSGQTKAMGSWEKRKPPKDGGEEFPGDPGGIAPVPVPVGPGGPGPEGGAVAPAGRTGARGSSKSGSANSPRGLKKAGNGTKVDGISGGTATQTNKTATGSISGSSGPGSGTGSSGGLTGGANGAAAGSAGGPGMVGQASGNRGMTGGGAGARGGATGGMRGGIGSGTGAGAGGKSGSAGGGRGPLARAKGGTLDTPGPGQGAARQGGSGLHSSRGGTESGQRGRTGMYGQGGAGANNGKRKGENSEGGQRPDYLVEDEETWMPKRRDVTPPTIG